ncbi:hypothetical protein ES703_109705 [subsurface metagenome]
MTTQTQRRLNDQHKKDTWFYLRSKGQTYFILLADLIKTYGSSVLDVGCGEALVLKHLPKDFQYTGIDLSDFIITRINIKNNSRNTCFYISDMFKPNVMGWYDVILFAGAFTILSKEEIHKLVKYYANRFKPNYILIADIKQVDLSLVEKNFDVVKKEVINFNFIKAPIPVGTPEQINNRQILLIKV